MRNLPDPKGLALQCAELAGQKKASEIVVLEVKGVFSLADYFVICSAESDRQVRAIAAHVEETLGRKGIVPLGVEGLTENRWVLMDYDDVILHIFQEEVRVFYDIEGLWREAPKVRVQAVVGERRV